MITYSAVPDEVHVVGNDFRGAHILGLRRRANWTCRLRRRGSWFVLKCLVSTSFHATKITCQRCRVPGQGDKPATDCSTWL